MCVTKCLFIYELCMGGCVYFQCGGYVCLTLCNMVILYDTWSFDTTQLPSGAQTTWTHYCGVIGQIA